METPLTAAPGAAFQYGGAPFQIFGALMSRKLAAAGRDPDPLAYLRERLLDPLGMDSSRWRRTLAGDAILPQGSVFTARDWARFGEFVRLGGRIDGVEIVDRETFDALFVGSEANPGYGVSWWLPRANSVPGVSTASTDIGLRPEGLPRDMVMAAGAGDQRLYVIPSLGLTIVRQADLSPERAMQAIREGRRRRDGPRWSDVDFIGIVTGQ
ncbi:MAG: hypothetical protein R3C16_09525 [Hyphomonadaceae bacterium]